MNLGAYLERIHYQGSLRPTLETLTALHRAHLLAIPYENLDIHLGRRLVLEERRLFEKIVRRGDWCYEMNGLFAWALRELGFRVDYLAGAVPRDCPGPDTAGNHLVLLVRLPEGDFIADMGFGDGFLEPIPFREGTYRQNGFEFRLEPGPEDGRWTVHNHLYGAAPTGASQHVLKTEEEYKTAMAEVFGLEADTSKPWPRVWARHLDWVRSQEAI